MFSESSNAFGSTMTTFIPLERCATVLYPPVFGFTADATGPLPPATGAVTTGC